MVKSVSSLTDCWVGHLTKLYEQFIIIEKGD